MIYVADTKESLFYPKIVSNTFPILLGGPSLAVISVCEDLWE